MTMIEYEKCVVGVSMVEQEIILLRNCLAGQVSFVQISHNVAFSIYWSEYQNDKISLAASYDF